MYSLQHGALAHTKQAIKRPKITSVKPFKLENQRSNLYKIFKKRETRNMYKLHKQTTTTVHQIPGYRLQTRNTYKLHKQTTTTVYQMPGYRLQTPISAE